MAADGDDGKPSGVRPVAKPEDIEGAVRRVLEEAVGHGQAERIATKVAPQLLQVAMSLWQAPVPPPAILREYEEVVPGSARDIMDAFKDEGAHRRRLEGRQMSLQWFGMICGVLIVFAMLGVSVYALTRNFAAVAGTVIVSLAAVAGVFVLRQRRAGGPKPAAKTAQQMTRAEQRNARFGRS